MVYIMGDILTGLLGVNLLVVLHLRVGSLLAQLHLLPKQRAEQPVDRVLLPRPPVLGRHEVLQLLVHVEPHLAALARPPVDVLLRLGLLHRRPPYRGLRRRAVARVGRALRHELLEEQLVKVGVVVDLRVLVDLARHLRRRAGPRRARALDEAVGVEELVLEAGDDRRLRRDEVAGLDLDVGAARLGGPHGIVRRRGVVLAALALRAGGLLRKLRGEQAGAEAVEGVEQLERGLLGGLVRLRALLVFFFRGGFDGGEGVRGDEGLLEADADVEEAVKGLALLADGEALLRVLLGGGGDCGGEGLLAFVHELALLGSGVGLGRFAAGLLVVGIVRIPLGVFIFVFARPRFLVIAVHKILVAAVGAFRIFVVQLGALAVLVLVLLLLLLVRDKVGSLRSLAAATFLVLGLRAAAENEAVELLVVAVAKGVVARDFKVVFSGSRFVGGKVGGLGVIELFAARVEVLLRILEHVAVVLVARIVQRIATDAGAAVLRSEGNALLFAELALAATVISILQHASIWVCIVPNGNIVLGARILVGTLLAAALVLALLDSFGLGIEICSIM
ncbi:hypothetical protein ColLi_04056 [Colletotrichum liriopes]|uniref:Uncharacterized protein n=1 Tax=Colletotrichum liriopes TaxID=708192 RepID=A0AA37GJ44_9PEZI|nr:hypothetical protein ColLi_04056 [Colletotrichum liriopes]